ncbi:MAG: MATE family efflux transporter [Lachnospiraceae bacterium]|nr:MATE family efflux transporter [Lachnospiraceae bacterium]MBR5993683.1 MATE family efflux transporter [Lachnospiraceae bacterium]
MKNKKYSMNMCEGPLFSKIWIFTIPLILSGLLQLLFNAVDMIVAGRYVGKEALAAIGSTSSLINLLTNVFIGLSTAANVLVARFFGSGQDKDVHETVHTSIALSFICGVIMSALGIIVAPKLLVLMGTHESVLPMATLYTRIYFLGMPVLMIYNFSAAILRAIGDTKRPLYYLTISGAINAICNVIFIVVFGMGVDGVAYATILSQAISAILTMRCLMVSDESYRFEFKKLRIYRDKLGQLLRLGLPAGFQGSIFSISNVLIQSSINSFGPDAMAGNSAACNIEGFVYVAMNTFHVTCLSFVSQNYGRHYFDRIKKIILICLGSVAAVGFIAGSLAYVFGPQLLSLYANDADKSVVIEYGMRRMAVIMFTYFTCGMMDTCVGAIRGLGYSVMPMIVSLLGACAFRVVWIFTIFRAFRSLENLYISYPISWTITTTVHLICFIIVYNKLKNKAY